jgi:hypothetical protein
MTLLAPTIMNCSQTLLTYIFGSILSPVLSDPGKRLEYDLSGCYEINQYTLRVRIKILLFFS